MDSLKHSEILLEFIAPLCEMEETERALFTKGQIGMLIWNCVVADQFDLKVKDGVATLKIKTIPADNMERAGKMKIK